MARRIQITPEQMAVYAVSELFVRMMVDCNVQTKTTAPDGAGGQGPAYADGKAIKAAVVKVQSAAVYAASKETGKDLYTITTEESIPRFSVVKRVSDGALFEIKSSPDDSKPPAEASFTFYQYQAERVIV